MQTLLPDGRPYGSEIENNLCNSATTQCDSLNPMNLYSFKIFYYEGDVVLPEACGYWKFKVRVGSNTSHRDYSITNIADSSWMYGEVCLNNLDTSYKNNSAICSSDMFQFACHNFPVTFPLQFSDPDQDSLVIQQIPTQTNGWTLNTLPSVDVPYLPPFTLTEPFQTGGTYQFNGSNGGSISFTAPAPQLPILTFKVDEYRNNVWMGSSLRDILFNIVNCNGAVPQMVYDSFNSQGITLSNDTFRVCSGTAFQMVHHYQSSDSNALLQVESNLSTLFSTANWQLSGPGGDSVSSLFSGLPNLSDTGTYSFWIKYTDTSCQAPGVLSPHWKYYTLQVLGSLQSLSNDTLCSGDTLQLQVQGPAPLNWYYSSPGFQCQSLACDTVRIWPSHDAYYIVSSTAASPACVQSDTVQIKVYEDFVVKSTDTSVCSSGSIALQATVQGGSLPLWYNWQPATGVIGSQTQPIVWVDPSLQQQWIVTVSDAQNCFQHSDTSEVLVDTNFHPEVAVGSLPLCIGDSVWMEVLGTNISVLWSPASGLSQMTGTGVYASPMENTLYTVYMVNDLSGCVADTSLWVEVHDIVADAGADRTIHAGETVKLG
ncbi:MAG TPA: hypothetical protein PLP14_08455, partial [Chitinophagaceae bacterium]|nr:hypothetical protein [Chitinophagaceae bacterium]